MNRPRIRATLLATLLFAASTVGATPSAGPAPCATVAATPEAIGTPVEVTGEITQVGSRPVEFWVHRARQARATLVFENGLMLPLTTWQKVVQAVAEEADILVYNRPGVGRSGALEQAQDPTYTSQLLHELLHAQNMSAPYIVVGHSLGGQYAQLFARMYAQEVSAILLVDSLPPGALKPGAQFPWYTQLGLRLLAPEYVVREITGAYAIGELLLSEPHTFDKPVIRLIAAPDPAAGKAEGWLTDLAKGVIYADDFGVWAVDPDIAEQHLDQLYPRSVVRHLHAPHRMQEEAPTPVIEALRELMTGAGCTPF